MKLLSGLFAALAVLTYTAKADQTVPDEAWDYVEVRPGANMFYWLYGSTADTPREETPLVMWLQGGPGGSSTGFGNFLEMGPLDTELQPRNTTWVQSANVLYVDQPVGTGYSYVTSADLFCKDLDEIATDLVTMFAAFLDTYPTFIDNNTPFFVFSESYGGKMTTGFATALLKAMQDPESGIPASLNFRGIALGDSWINGASYVKTWGPLLRQWSLLDINQAASLQKVADACVEACDKGEWLNATALWGQVENVVEEYTDNVDFYNMLLHNVDDDERRRVLREVEGAEDGEAVARALSRGSILPPHMVAGQEASLRGAHLATAARSLRSSAYRAGQDLSTYPLVEELGGVENVERLLRWHVDAAHPLTLSQLMNGPIRTKLGIIPSNVTWGGQAGQVFTANGGDFMTPVQDELDALLAIPFNVTIYEGQLDLICATVGAEDWMSQMAWSGMDGFYSSPKTPLYPFQGTQQTGAFVKESPVYGGAQLSLYTIMQAGHMVPHDQGQMALVMLQRILAQQAEE